MNIIVLLLIAFLIVFTIQLLRVALYLKRVNNIDKPLSQILYVLLNAPLHKDLNHPNTFSKIRVSCVYYIGVATGYQFVRSKINYPDNKG